MKWTSYEQWTLSAHENNQTTQKKFDGFYPTFLKMHFEKVFIIHE